MATNITKNIISRVEAERLAPAYARFALGDLDALGEVLPAFEKLKRGQAVLTFTEGVFVKARVSSVNHDDIRAEDGPVVRVSNGEFSGRVDGHTYAFPL